MVCESKIYGAYTKTPPRTNKEPLRARCYGHDRTTCVLALRLGSYMHREAKTRISYDITGTVDHVMGSCLLEVLELESDFMLVDSTGQGLLGGREYSK